MRNNSGNDDLRNKRAFENATWILTDKKTGKFSEYDYSEMSRIVIDAYRSHTRRFAGKPVTIRYLHRVSCNIYRDGHVESLNYSQILPNYTIDCYNWRYQCPHCNAPQDEVKGKEEKKEVVGFYCLPCREYIEL